MTNVGYADITDLANQYAGAGQSVKAVAQGVIHQVIGDIEQYAREFAPARSGVLRASITSFVLGDGLTGVVRATAPYAAFVELGTGIRGEFPGSMITIRPKKANGMLRWVGSDGRVHYAKVVHSPGMKAHPFLRPALAKAIDELESRLGAAVATSLMKGPNP